MESLLSVQELLSAQDLPAPASDADTLCILDATQFLPNASRDARAEYCAGHIPGALFMDLAEIRDSTCPIANMAPPLEKFVSRMRALGLSNRRPIVLYDNSPIKSATRAWWLFRLFGFYDVALLDGGLAAWQAAGLPLEKAQPIPPRSHLTADYTPAILRSKQDILDSLDDIARARVYLVDARSAARFSARADEPRSGMAAGHIVGARNLPYTTLFQAKGLWKRGDALRAVFVAAGVDLEKPLVATCGSGMTAAAVIFAAHLLGKEDWALYDGSWAEWGSDPDTPKNTAPSSDRV